MSSADPKRTPFFSVVTPSFNQGAWIEGCIRSVLAQGTDDFEHLIFDNCSQDETASVLARFPHLRVTTEPDRGQAHAINKGLAQARGEIICWLNADDQYEPGAFEIVRREMARPGVDVIFGDAREIFFDGRDAGIHPARFERREDFLVWWERRTDLLQPAVFFRRSAAEETGPLREDLHLILDTEYWWRLSARHRFHHVDAVLAVQQRQPESKTISATHRIYLEKARVFGPLLAEAYPHDRLRHAIARRRRMCWRWLNLARAAGSRNRGLAWQNLCRSVAENPLMLLSPTWWRTLCAPSA